MTQTAEVLRGCVRPHATSPSRRYSEVALMPNTKREQMGEVHVRVRLSNPADLEQAAQGLIDKEKVRSYEVEALVDTGATRSVIPPEILHQLGVSIHRQTTGRLADGSRVSVGMSGPITFEIQGRETCEDAYVVGEEVLIGQTTLESTDLRVDCKNQKVIPNPAHPDGPVFRI